MCFLWDRPYGQVLSGPSLEGWRWTRWSPEQEAAVASLVHVVTSFARLMPRFIHMVSVQAGKPLALGGLGSEVLSSLNHSDHATLPGEMVSKSSAFLSKAALRQQPRGAGCAVRHQARFSLSHLLTLQVVGLG